MRKGAYLVGSCLRDQLRLPGLFIDRQSSFSGYTALSAGAVMLRAPASSPAVWEAVAMLVLLRCAELFFLDFLYRCIPLQMFLY